MITHPGKANYRGTLAGALQFHFNTLSDVAGKLRPGIVHRLDRDTSGVIVVAKDNQVHHLLSRQFERREVTKEYRAIVWGVIDRDAGLIQTFLRVNPKRREAMMVCEEEGNARQAVTRFKKCSNASTISATCSTPAEDRTDPSVASAFAAYRPSDRGRSTVRRTGPAHPAIPGGRPKIRRRLRGKGQENPPPTMRTSNSPAGTARLSPGNSASRDGKTVTVYRTTSGRHGKHAAALQSLRRRTCQQQNERPTRFRIEGNPPPCRLPKLNCRGANSGSPCSSRMGCISSPGPTAAGASPTSCMPMTRWTWSGRSSI